MEKTIVNVQRAMTIKLVFGNDLSTSSFPVRELYLGDEKTGEITTRVDSMGHEEMLAECKVARSNIETKLDEHIHESVGVRDNVTTLVADMKTMIGMRGAVYGIVLAIFVQVGGFIYLWGGMQKTIDVSERRLNIIETKIDDMQRYTYRHDEARSSK